MEDFAKLFSQVGFPAGIAIYLLVRMEKKIGELTTIITTLKNSIDKHTDSMNGSRKSGVTGS